MRDPWDRPAGLEFTDGVRVGAALDRNGLRPLRYAVCEDGLIACASEAGAVDVRGHGRVRRGKLGPGRMLWVDPDHGGVEDDETTKARLAAQQPHGAWLNDHLQSNSPRAPVGNVPADPVARQAP